MGGPPEGSVNRGGNDFQKVAQLGRSRQQQLGCQGEGWGWQACHQGPGGGLHVQDQTAVMRSPGKESEGIVFCFVLFCFVFVLFLMSFLRLLF